MTKPKAIALNRRTILAAAGAATAALAAPRILRAQGKELVVGGAAGFAPWMNGTVSQAFEAKYNSHLIQQPHLCGVRFAITSIRWGSMAST